MTKHRLPDELADDREVMAARIAELRSAATTIHLATGKADRLLTEAESAIAVHGNIAAASRAAAAADVLRPFGIVPGERADV